MRALTLLSAALLAACAAAPGDREAAPVDRAAPAAPVAAATVAPTTPTAAGSTETSGPSNDNLGEPAVAKAKAGYSLSKQNGQTVYCRREVPTGSRRPITNCYTPAQLEEIERQTKETQDAMERQRNSSGCGKFCSAGS